MKRFSKKLLSVMLSVLLAVTALPIGAMTANADTLSDAKSAFTAKIEEMRTSSGDSRVIYTNLSNAYDAYVAACADGAGDAEAKALNDEVAKMTKFTGKSDSYQVKFNGTDTGNYSNVIWAECLNNLTYSAFTPGSVYSDSGTSHYGNDFYVYQPSAVLLYDGQTDAKIPVLFAIRQTNGKWNFRYGYVSESGGRLSSNWSGYNIAGSSSSDLTQAAVVPTSTSYSIPKESTKSSTSDDGYVYFDMNASYAAGSSGDNTGFYTFKNSLTFTLKDSDINRKYSSFEWNVYPYWYNLWNANQHLANGDTRLTTSNTVFVLNYKKLLDSIKSTIDKYDDAGSILDTTTSTFATGTSSKLFAALDNATSLNLMDKTKYPFADGASNERIYLSAANDINNAISVLNAAGGASADGATLKRYIEKYESNMKENPFRTNLQSTYKLYLQAKEYYDAYIFGDTEALAADETFINNMHSVATNFQNAVDNQQTFATKNADGTYTAVPETGTWQKDKDTNDGIKFFSADSYTGSAAYEYYNNTEKAANNILYFPTETAVQNIYTDNGTEKGGKCVYQYNNGGAIQINVNDDKEKTNQSTASKFQLYYPNNIVLLYNGQSSKPMFPIMLRHSSTNGSGAGHRFDSLSWLNSLYPTSAGVKSKEYYSSGSSFVPLSSFPDSTEWNIRTKTVSGNGYSAEKGWSGGCINNTNRDLDFQNVFEQKSLSSNITGDDVGIAGGSSSEELIGDKRLKSRRDSGKWNDAAATALVYEDTYFEDKNTSTTEASSLYKNYPSINWYLVWHESFSGDGYWFDKAFTDYSDINVINTQPLTAAENTLLQNSDLESILQYVYLYDKDSKDYKTLLEKIDAVGNFDPNSYDYSVTTGGTLDDTTNKGVSDCVAAMQNIITKINSVSENISSTDEDGTVKVPDDKDKEQDSESTGDNTNSRDTDGWYDWYNNLRNALMNPLSYDGCASGTAWTAYQTAQTNARKALVTIAANSSSDDNYYPNVDTNTGKTIDELAKELTDAKEAYANSGGEHTYLYSDEDADQNSTWDCEYNTTHAEAHADMSAYNELDIAYNTIDPEAYTNFKEKIQKVYDGTGKTDSEKYDNSDDKATTDSYTNLSFVQVKTQPAAKGGLSQKNINEQTTSGKDNDTVVQEYVDAAITNLLTAINTASSETETTTRTNPTTGKEETVTVPKNLNTYNVVFKCNIEGEKNAELSSGVYSYGALPTFDASKTVDENGNTIDWDLFKNNNAKVYKWSIERKKADGTYSDPVYFEYKSDIFQCIIQEDCRITAYAKPGRLDTQKVLNIYGPTGELIKRANVNDSDPVKLSYSSTTKTDEATGKDAAINSIIVQFGSDSYTINATTSYDVANSVKINGKDVPLTGDVSFDSVSDLLKQYPGPYISIKAASKKLAAKTYTISAKGVGGKVIQDKLRNSDGSVTPNVDRGTDFTGVDYDTKIKIKYTPDSSVDGGTLYGIAINASEITGSSTPRYIAISYDDEYYFRANRSMSFYPIYQKKTATGGNYYVVETDEGEVRITNANDSYYFNRKLPFAISYMDTDNVPGKFVFRCVYTAGLPENVNVTEHGWVYARYNGSGSATDETYSQALQAIDLTANELTVDKSGTQYNGIYKQSKDDAGITYTADIRKQPASKIADIESHQYSFSSKDRPYNFIYARAYIKFEYEFTQTEKKNTGNDENNSGNDEKKVTSATIEAVSYGTADSYINPIIEQQN